MKHLLSLLLSIPVAASAIELHPKLANGTQGNGTSERPALSDDGRYLALQTGSNSLGYTASPRDILLIDRVAETIERLTEAAGGGAGNGFSNTPDISDDGNRVVFQSFASNLVASDLNGTVGDVFLYDRTDGLQLLSVDLGSDGANDASFGVVISGDGSSIAFISRASDLVAGDTEGAADVFLWREGVITRVSQTPAGAGGDSNATGIPAISEDGDVIAFESTAQNLAPEKTTGPLDILVGTVSTGAFEVASKHSNGTLGNALSNNPSLSGSGRYVAFSSIADNLVDSDAGGFSDIFRHDRVTGETILVSRNSAGTQGNGDSFGPKISSDGRYVAFYSSADNLVPDDMNGVADFFIRDTSLNTVFRASVDEMNNEVTGSSDLFFDFSSDGSTIAFSSGASDLVTPDTNSQTDVFVTQNPLLIRVDSLIGLSPSFSEASGNGIYTNNAALQRVSRLIKKKQARSFYWFAQNDGLSPDSLLIRSTRPKGRLYSYTVQNLDGAGNVTAAVLAGTAATDSLEPQEHWHYRATVKGKNQKGAHSLLLTSASSTDPNVADRGMAALAFKAKVKRKRR